MRSPEPPDSTDPQALYSAQIADGMPLLFDNYVLHEKLGQGGFGIVFRARRVGDDEFVALKQMRGGAQASPEERREFLAGAETARALDHHGIVGVREVGESEEGCPFFTMQLIAGGNLATALDSTRPSQGEAARSVRSIALAVAHAHSRGVLHSDLKPANILLNEQGEMFVTDFGSARRLQHGQCVESGAGVLSYYMAPEQASGDVRSLTHRADIYSLGVILYELLTGQVPDEHRLFATWLQRLVSEDPVPPPRKLVPGLNRDLELVCLKCLEKEPSRRYASAELLADDLELVLSRRRPRHARLDRAASRSLRWVRRHPAWSATMGAVVLIAAVASIAALALFQAESRQQQIELETNGFIANSQAGALLFQLREFADRVAHCGQRPEVHARLAAGVVSPSAPELEACGRGFQSVWLMSRQGQLLSQWPSGGPVLGQFYDFRGYFRGARELFSRGSPGVYLGPAFRAETSRELEFAFAAPIIDGTGQWLGIVVGSLGADSAIGQVRMKDSHESGRIVALLGPRDNDRLDANGNARGELDFVVHPQLDHGREVALREPSRGILERAFGATSGEQFSMRWAPPLLLSNYRDPLLEPAQSSLAAFAPVGHTGYVVVVQTAREMALHDARSLTRRIAWRAGLPLVLGLSLLGFGVLLGARRKRSLETRPRRPVSGSRAIDATSSISVE